MYDTGTGVPQNSDTAMVWYKKAAEQGNSNAALAIGYNYDTGTGVKKIRLRLSTGMQKQLT